MQPLIFFLIFKQHDDIAAFDKKLIFIYNNYELCYYIISTSLFLKKESLQCQRYVSTAVTQ